MSDSKSSNRIQDEIDENLKRVYQEALNEELPDRFLQLLDRLKSGNAEGMTPDKDEA
ncbi:NepR family anti-sigma factor [Aestuariibius sp. 2305UL40-4]|uniref:NepR family anti-sigma factor n=1 Tax=Aestuariibius violaceus TaxID=3234132 RepID=UPI00345E2D14